MYMDGLSQMHILNGITVAVCFGWPAGVQKAPALAVEAQK